MAVVDEDVFLRQLGSAISSAVLLECVGHHTVIHGSKPLSGCSSGSAAASTTTSTLPTVLMFGLPMTKHPKPQPQADDIIMHQIPCRATMRTSYMSPLPSLFIRVLHPQRHELEVICKAESWGCEEGTGCRRRRQ
jgi:hypothetical protein